jgi:amino acid adenylation domain-containing protein
MTAHELLVQLRALNVRIALESGRLRVVEPATGTLNEELWRELQRNREEILRVLEHATQSKKTRIPIKPMERPQNIPLSFAQQRLWFLAQMEGVSEAYHIPMGLRLSGELDRDALKRALDRIVWRHEALRTTFRAGEPPEQQILEPDCGFDLQEHDLSGHADAAAELEQLKKEEASRRFALEHNSPIRGHLIRLAAQEHVLLLTIHHIASDGWSLGVLIHELSTLYRAYHAGEEDPLHPLVVQYADYALWQQQLLSGEVLQRESEYWRRTLDGVPALLELPTDRPRPAQQSFIGDVVEIEMDAALTRALKALAQRYEATLYMLVVAAWAVVLSRLSGQEEVVIGTVTANRTRPEIEALIGFFVNTLALRVEVSGDVADMLRRVKARALEAQEHQELPFEQVVEIVKPPRSLAYTPIFQVMLAWQAKDERAPDFAGLNLAFVPVFYAVAKFDLALDLRESGDRIVGGLRYPTALFDRGTIERHAGYLRQVLAAMVADSQQAVAGIDLLLPQERTMLLETWNATEAPYPEHLCIHQLFEEQVRKTPRATAVVHESQSLTYVELNQSANRLAHYLITLGVMPDDRVAICVERNLGLVVGLMAILKAGGAYVPLDPAYPSQRLTQILADAAPRIVLIDSTGREALGLNALKGLRLVDLNESQPAVLTELPATNPHAQTLGLTSRHLAYLIYTSGSTGNPKGVMIEHASAVNLLSWATKVFAAAETTHTLFSTSIQFDLSIYELFMPLACGTTVYLVEDALVVLDSTHSVSLINTVPSAITAFLDQQDLPTSIRTINLAGEPLKKTLIQKLFEQSQAERACNLYGPTETTTYSTWISMERGEQIFESIGRPIANTRIYLLDNNRQPVPLGAVGELYIGGAGVARGYLNRPDLTAERFLQDPFSANPQARMYKTGDLGRYRPDGNIEYLGRNDFQVKIRGFRIELGEIEARLAEHPSVREAVALMREDHPGDKRLAAYVTAKAASVIDVEALRLRLSSLLPEYMVPPAYVVLEKLPLTPNGKLDRKALPSPDAGAYATRGYEPPVGELETTVTRVWAEVLKRDRVGRKDNFFDLGGHSLLILKVTSLLRQLGIETTVANLFNHPTVESFAASLRKVSASTAHRGAQKIREGTQTPLFLVHDGGGSELYCSALAQYLPRELPMYVLPSVSWDEPQLHTMRAMAQRMVRLIQEVHPVGPYQLAGWSFGGVLAYEIAQLLLDQEYTVEFLGLIDAWNFDGRGIGEHHKRTPEMVLRDLCEGQRMEKPDGLSAAAAFNAPGPDLSFDELFNHYRGLQALPENFEHLAPHEARVECNKLEHHLQVMAAYSPRPIGIPVHLFVASERPVGGPLPTAALGWERCVPEYLLYAQTVPGSHRSLMKPPNIKMLGRRLTESLATAVTLPGSSNIFQAKASE